MSTLTAGAPSYVLLDRLEKAGWGNLAGPELRGVRGVLAALTRLLDPKSAQGKATAYEIAERAGYSDRWTRRCLQVLEELELIEWDRGGVVDGRPVPSWFRVSKRALLILVQIARTTAQDRRAAHQEKVRARIADHHLKRTIRGRNRRPAHAEVVTALLFKKEVPEAEEPSGNSLQGSPESKSDAVAQIRAAIAAQRGLRPAQGRESKTATTRRERRSLSERLAEYAPDLETVDTHAGPIGGSAQ